MKKFLLAFLFALPFVSYAQPNWVSDAVWYQIFPERFRNGDPTNDPPLRSQWYCWPHDTTGPWKVHPWTSDWYALQPWEEANGKGLNWNITRRRYGGDLQGVMEKIPYLKSLGINAIYFNPVFMAPSAHKYDAVLYHHIDPYLGPNPNKDLRLMAAENPSDPSTWQWTSADKLALRLIDSLHKVGIRVIFDGVFNHMGVGSFPFLDIEQSGAQSIYRDWFSIKQFPDAATGQKLEYDGWFGVKDLPEIREDEQGIVKGPKEYIFACTKRWMDPNGDGKPHDGIDGWRLDVAFCVKHAFWKDWRTHVKAINPEAYLTAEVIDSIPVLKPYLEGDEFDAVMNYNVGFLMADFFLGSDPLKPSQFAAKLETLRNALGTDPHWMMNLFDSHDTNRMASHIVNKNKVKYHEWGAYFNWSRALEHPDYLTRKPTAAERKIQRQMLAFMFSYLGSPMLYYGTEAGMWGANDPDCRKPMLWDDLAMEAELLDAQGKVHPPGDENRFDAELFTFCKKLISIRKTHRELRRGQIQVVLSDDKNRILGFRRSLDTMQVVAYFHTGTARQTLYVPSQAVTRWRDLMTDKEYPTAKGTCTLSLEPGEFLLLKAMP